MSNESVLSVAAISGEAKQIMLIDGTILAIRSFHDEDGRETDDFEGCTTILVVDHRTRPPTYISIATDSIEYSPEA
jgi:hypothetical protein